MVVHNQNKVGLITKTRIPKTYLDPLQKLIQKDLKLHKFRLEQYPP